MTYAMCLLTYILFADDTSCFIEGTDLSDMCIQVSTKMNKLSTWFKTNSRVFGRGIGKLTLYIF